MSILVIAEHDNQTLAPVTASVVSAAKAIGGDIHLLVAGSGCDGVAQAAAKLEGVAKVLQADDAAYTNHLGENMAALVAGMGKDYSHILAPATTLGKDFMPRVAALLDMQQISEIIAVEAPDTFKRPIYAGNAIETVKSSDAVKVITVRPTAFDKMAEGGSAAVESVSSAGDTGLSSFVNMQASSSERPDLTAARVVISGGRGFGSGEKFKALLEPLADKLGAAIGASRAAVDAGYVPNDYQVGQTGKVVAPELYIAVGISGAIQHLAGMKDSKVIVAINKDENAPIFEIADYGLVGDLFEIIPQLEKSL